VTAWLTASTGTAATNSLHSDTSLPAPGPSARIATLPSITRSRAAFITHSLHILHASRACHAPWVFAWGVTTVMKGDEKELREPRLSRGRQGPC
jgi:hypothetical protein